MKIKEVCKAANLTDKAVRFYINNGLINPDYTENYAGRKNYTFSDNDLEVLEKIALLRSCDFSVNDIKRMLDDESEIYDVLENHIYEMKINTAQSSSILNNLLNASITGSTSLDDLCLALEEGRTAENEDEQSFDFKGTVRGYTKKIKSKIPKIILLSSLAVLAGIAIVSIIIILLTHLFLSLGGNV